MNIHLLGYWRTWAQMRFSPWSFRYARWERKPAASPPPPIPIFSSSFTILFLLSTRKFARPHSPLCCPAAPISRAFAHIPLLLRSVHIRSSTRARGGESTGAPPTAGPAVRGGPGRADEMDRCCIERPSDSDTLLPSGWGKEWGGGG